MERKKNTIGISVIIITYLVGIAGFSIKQTKELFVWMSPYHLLLVLGILLLLHKKWDKGFYLFLILCFLISFSSELIGVHTSYLFGNYSYGKVLGVKFFEVPLIIGLNWIMLVYSSYTLASNLSDNNWLSALFSASILVILDYIMEPSAVQLGFWKWHSEDIPIYNYVCWFAIGYLLSLIAGILNLKGNAFLSLSILICQAIFFITLQIMI